MKRSLSRKTCEREAAERALSSRKGVFDNYANALLGSALQMPDTLLRNVNFLSGRPLLRYKFKSQKESSYI
jgi:hypothetical protein